MKTVKGREKLRDMFRYYLFMTHQVPEVRVVQKLQSEYLMPEHVEIMDGGTLGLDILPRLGGGERLLMVDAVETGQGAGICVRLSGEEIPQVLENRISLHQMGMKGLLAVARLIGTVPKEIVLIGYSRAVLKWEWSLLLKLKQKLM